MKKSIVLAALIAGLSLGAGAQTQAMPGTEPSSAYSSVGQQPTKPHHVAAHKAKGKKAHKGPKAHKAHKAKKGHKAHKKAQPRHQATAH